MLASGMGHQHSWLAECFFSFQLCENEEVPGGRLVWEPAWHPPLFCVTRVGPDLLLALHSPAPKGKELLTSCQVSHGLLKPAALGTFVSNLAASLQPRHCFLKLLLDKPLSKTQGPVRGSPQHVLAHVGVRSLPSAALGWTIQQHTMAPNGTLCFTEIAEQK